MRIVIVEDSVLLREGIARLLTESGHEVVAQLVDTAR
jgi:DNA-binding response OmpR family regulator